MRVLAIDPGSKNIGLAISDPTGTIANPLSVVKHESRSKDTECIAALVDEHEVGLVIIGSSSDEEGLLSYEGRKAQRFAMELTKKIDVPVKLWSEDFSTQIARKTRIQMGVKRKNRKGHLDDLAATVILQTFLDNEMNRN